MKKLLLLFSCLAMCLTACQNNDELNGGDDNKTPKFTIEAVMDGGDDTRTIIDKDGKAKWIVGDEIDVLKETSAAGPVQTFKFTASELSKEDNRAVFTTTQDFKLDANSSGYYVAGYPSGTISDGGLFPVSLSCKLAATQTYDAENMVASKCNPSVAAEAKTDFEANKLFHFKNICGLLRLKFIGNATIKKISFTSKEGQYVSGTCYFDPFFVTNPSWSDTDKSNTVELDCGAGVALDATTAKEFYIVLPPNTYNGFTIEAEDVSGNKKQYTSSKDHTITRSKIHGIAALDFTLKGVWYNINNTGWKYWGTSTSYTALPAKATAGTFALKTDEGYTFSQDQMNAVNTYVKTSTANGSIDVDMNDAVFASNTIAASTFLNNSKLKSIALPKNVTELGTSAFEGCGYMKSISNTEQITTLNEKNFYKCGSLGTFPVFNVTRYPKWCFMACGFTSVKVPEGVTYLGQQCLNGLTQATEIDLPSTVETLFQSTLGNCPKVANFYCRAMVAPVTTNTTATTVFNAGNIGTGVYIGKSVDPANRKLHVPKGAKGYENDKTQTDEWYNARKDWWQYLLNPTSFNWTISYEEGL